MTRHVITAQSDAALHVAARLMIEHRVGAILVTDPEGSICGVVSYVDVLSRLVEEAVLDETALGLMDRD
jgi:predicted transcriptional regulator